MALNIESQVYDNANAATPVGWENRALKSHTIGEQLVAALAEIDRLKGELARARREWEKSEQQIHILNREVARQEARRRVDAIDRRIEELHAERSDLEAEFDI